MNNVILFEKQDFKIRVLGDNNKPLFCLADICRALGLTKPSMALKSLESEFGKGVNNSYPLETNGGLQNIIFIQEAHLYFLLMRSTKPFAKDFRQWIFNEVLPSIRKSGSYKVERLKEAQDYNVIMQGYSLLMEKREQLESELKSERELKEKLIHSGDTYTATEVAKELNLKSARELNTFLQDARIIYWINKQYAPYSIYADKGYFSLKSEILNNKPRKTFRITSLGRAFIVKNFEVIKQRAQNNIKRLR